MRVQTEVNFQQEVQSPTQRARRTRYLANALLSSTLFTRTVETLLQHQRVEEAAILGRLQSALCAVPRV